MSDKKACQDTVWAILECVLTTVGIGLTLMAIASVFAATLPAVIKIWVLSKQLFGV